MHQKPGESTESPRAKGTEFRDSPISRWLRDESMGVGLTNSQYSIVPFPVCAATAGPLRWRRVFVQIVCVIGRAAGVLELNDAVRKCEINQPMKSQTRPCRFLPILATALLAAWGATCGFARGAGAEAPAAAQSAAPSPFYDLEIEDGFLIWNGAKRKDNANRVPATVPNAVDLLRELHPEANFAASPALAGTVIADLKMRTSSAEEKLEALRIASGAAFLWRKANAPGINPQTSLPASPDLFVLDVSPAEPKPGLQVEAFNINTYIRAWATYPTPGNGNEEDPQKRMEQIGRVVLETVKEYDAVRQGARPRANPLQTPSIKFHPGANLVIVIGEPEAVAVAAKVIGALPGAQRSVAASARESDGSTRETPADELSKRARLDGSRPAGQR